MNICYVVLNGQSQNINFTREKTVEDWLPFLSIKVQRSTPLHLCYTKEILYGSNNSSYFSACSRASSILCGSFNRSPLRLLYKLEILYGSINNSHFSASSRAPSNPLWYFQALQSSPPPLKLIKILHEYFESSVVLSSVPIFSVSPETPLKFSMSFKRFCPLRATYNSKKSSIFFLPSHRLLLKNTPLATNEAQRYLLTSKFV
nr:unnamed protein product [Haemonchus contortus]